MLFFSLPPPPATGAEQPIVRLRGAVCVSFLPEKFELRHFCHDTDDYYLQMIQELWGISSTALGGSSEFRCARSPSYPHVGQSEWFLAASCRFYSPPTARRQL
ncbi:hypothetical protein PoB_005506800 [Plakobranchus ocellatus]|uniref:Uncharacterized protein n=1 Tax=Plakobranchus ocellatus TaxID=259542 RepID=A0AAV4CAN3_9GAST|nr:hypothetical protein PoB_005506800 [Plakobranchus ocellatus]